MRNKSPELKALKRKRRVKRLIISLSIIAVLVLAVVVANVISIQTTISVAKKYDKVQYENQLRPTFINDYTSFMTDEDFKVLQITDVHIGGGILSYSEDKKAVNAVASMITSEKPDLVIFTGDLAFPVPYIAGTFNNKSGAKILATLMEELGVYWTVAFGNHDTEAYSYFNREKISEFYSSEKFEHCLFTPGPTDIYGFGNQVLNVVNSDRLITQSLVIFDSNAYTDGDVFGINWIYDNIHDDQIAWYEEEILKIKALNKETAKSKNLSAEELKKYENPKSLAFFHIPLEEYRFAYDDYTKNNADTADTKYLYGEAGEDPNGEMVYPPRYENNLFEKMLELNSTQGIFVGHDHLNNFAFTYKGIDLHYGMSIDYLAYSDIDNFGAQRGCTVIKIKPDGTYESELQNYYLDKYKPIGGKEDVSMEPYYGKN